MTAIEPLSEQFGKLLAVWERCPEIHRATLEAKCDEVAAAWLAFIELPPTQLAPDQPKTSAADWR